MRLFLDTSVVLAACGSERGASSETIRLAASNRWTLLVTAYVVAEVERNLDAFGPAAAARWSVLYARLTIVQSVFAIDRPAVFGPAKDRPILFSALAWADVLLTLDRGDFQDVLGTAFYGLAIRKPGDFLESQRAIGRLIDER